MGYPKTYELTYLLKKKEVGITGDEVLRDFQSEIILEIITINQKKAFR